MISYKHITKIIGVLMAAAVVSCFWLMTFSQETVETLGGGGVPMAYEETLFDTDEPMQIDIQMTQEEWEEMLENATAEEYHSCDVLINDQKIYNVGIRPKGNTSLSSIASNPDTDRFSLKLEFDHYVDGQSCLGLDKLILNNNYADPTCMKEALVYDMYQYLGADASLYNYAEISVNGEYLGVYLALEAVEESFLMRNYGTEDGELYKPDSMDMGDGGHGGADGQPPQPDGQFPGEWQKPENNAPADGETAPDDGQFSEPGEGQASGNDRSKDQETEPEGGHFPEPGEEQESESNGATDEVKPDFERGMPLEEGDFDFADRGERRTPDMGEMPDGGHSRGGGNGADLNYTDEELSSYSDIWEGEVTDTGDADHSRVVRALKNISEGTELEIYLDVDNVLKYMAVHTFSVNMDSLSGNMAHNYYLYENNGMLNIIPWDYNLSFGGMNHEQGSDASEVVNDAVDSPFQATEFFDALLEDETYLFRYHEYLEQLAQEYVLGGRFQEVYQRIRGQIDTLVETDPTALYSYEEYEAGAEMLYQTVLLRAESIKGQVEGTIPSTDEGQQADATNLVDASAIDISVMGAMDMGKGGDRKSARAEKGQ